MSDLLQQILDDMDAIIGDYCGRCRMAPCVCPPTRETLHWWALDGDLWYCRRCRSWSPSATQSDACIPLEVAVAITSWPSRCPQCDSGKWRQDRADANPWCRNCGHSPTPEECRAVQEGLDAPPEPTSTPGPGRERRPKR